MRSSLKPSTAVLRFGIESAIFDFCHNLEFFSQNPDFKEGSAAEPLSTRLFKARLQLLTELDKRLRRQEGANDVPASPHGNHPTLSEVRNSTSLLLQQQVAAMNVNNFVVRPQRQFVERYAKAEVWRKLSPEALHELESKVAGLPTELTDEDEEAKRFDMLLLRAQLSILQAKPDFPTLKTKVQAIAGALEEQMAIPAIKAEMVLIQSVASDEWWEDVTIPMLETARKRLRALVKLIPKGQKKIVYTDFEDELGDMTAIDLPQVTAGLNMAKFKEKARVFLKEHESHLSLQRLRRNQSLTPTDLDELEKMLLAAGGSKTLIDEAKEQSQGLGLFIRSLVGLDREAAMQAFSEFLQGGTASPDQIEFINLIVQELTRNGIMPAERLFQSPFTDVNAQGPLGVFPQARVTKIVEVLETIRGRAAAWV